MIRTGIATVSISGSLEEKLHAAAAAGFDGIELFENDFIASPLSAAQVRGLAAELGLSIDLYQPVRDLEGTDPATFAAALRRVEAKLDLAVEVGAPGILLCSNVGTATIDDDALMIEQLRAAADLAAERGLVVSYEALAWGKYVSTYDRAWDLVRRADHPALGICLDSFHIMSRGTPLEGIADIPGEKITFVQLADAPIMHLDPLSWSRHYRLFHGQGGWDLVAFMTAISRAGYTGPWSLEIFNDVYRQTDPYRTSVDALRSLRWLADEVGRADPGLVPLTGALPPVSTPTAIDFVELAPDPDGRLERFLDAAGLDRLGRHRAKDEVRLWSSGEVRVVLNPRPVSRQVPDRTLTAIGVQVPDAADAVGRAAGLLAPRFDRTAAAGDADLHGLIAPDGTEVYLSESGEGAPRWTGEFTGGTASELAPVLTAIDHVALANPWQHSDEATLFYRSVLGLATLDPVDVTDPHGLVRSRAMESPNGAIRLALNVLPPGLEDSGSARTVGHIAFSTEDVITAVEQLRAGGIVIVTPPDNYYDDLAARFPLSEERVAELRWHGLFYDRDADGGEYLQAYTERIGGIFFEVVERLGGYRGYGALNSMFRRAAQQAAALI